MNIEEAIKYIKNDIEIDKDTASWFENGNMTKEQIEESIDAYETLLTAYEKEKEKNRTIKTYKSNLPDNVELICLCKNDFERNISNDYISKDKIKAKIEELEIEQESNREDLKIAIDNLLFQNIDKIGNKISINMSVRGILQSLLEKE